MHYVTTSADIATAFEESVRALKALTNTAASFEDVDFSPAEHLGLLKNAAQRLAIWSEEHDVETGSLDHALRESSRLKRKVIGLLNNLCSVKWPSSLFDSEDESEGSLMLQEMGPVERTGEVRTSPSSYSRSSSSERRDQNSTRQTSDEGSIGIDTNISVDSSVDADTTRGTVDYVHKIITLLFEMGPSLRHPAPSDRLNINSDPVAASPDIQHVETMFPGARKEFQRQLGVANWERRQCLIQLRERRTKVLEQLASATNPYQEMIKRTASQFLPVNDFSPKPMQKPDRSTPDSILLEEPSMTSASLTHVTSAPVFDFSQTYDAQSTFMTEITNEVALESPSPKYEGYTHAPRKLKIPFPPSPNEDFTGAAFLCPYCMSEIEGLETREDWIEHIYLDLRPYMCTYVACSRPLRFYPSRSSWWAHERSEHRIQKVWECSPCQRDNLTFRFLSLKDFEDHVEEHHPKLLRTEERRGIAQFCEKETGVLPPHKECPLCREPTTMPKGKNDSLNDATNEHDDEVQAHIADHFEQLALYVALPTGNVQSDRDINDFIDDSDTDDDRKEDIKSLASVEDRQAARHMVRERNVERYFKDQDAHEEPFNMHPSLLDNLGKPRANISADKKRGERRPSKTSAPGQRLGTKWPLNTIRQPRSEFFTGKEDVLKEMSWLLERRGGIYVLSGLGGVGKTLTAVEFSYRCQDHFECIFWLQADTPEGLAQSFVEINLAIGLEVKGDNQKRDIEHGRDWLGKTERRWLLIFDNAESWDAISTYIPYQFPTSQGSILITTQNDRIKAMDRNLKLQKLNVLEPEDGADMLLSYLRKAPEGDDQEELAREISSFVGGLPIAIAHVAGYADYSDYTLEDLLEIFRDWRKVVGVATDEADDLPASFRQDAFSYDDTLAMVYNVTLRELNADAQSLMNILAYLNCEAVPESMIWNMHEESDLAFLDSREKHRVKSTKKALISRRLVQQREVNGELCFSVHRALQRSIRNTLAVDPEKQQQVFSQAVRLLRDVYPTSSPIQQPKPEKWFEFQRLLPHLNSLKDVYVSRKPKLNGSLEFARILSDAGINQWERGMTKEGLTLLRTSEGVLDALQFESNDTLRADIHIIVALMYDNTGVSNRQDAIGRRVKALEIREAEMQRKKSSASAYRDNEVLLYNARMDHAISLLQFHDYRKAEPIIDACLEKYKEWGTPEELPYEYGKYYNKMALVRLYQQRFDEAIDLATQGVTWMRKTKNFSLESRFDFDLACILLQCGKVEESRQLHQRIFDSRVEKLGQSSELTLHSRFAIGAISEMKGQYVDAEYWFNRALSLHKAAAWSEEAVARTKFHYARTLDALGRSEEAKNFYEDARESLRTLTEGTEGAWTGLKPGASEAILFDHILTICGARFTGLGLLDHIS